MENETAHLLFWMIPRLKISSILLVGSRIGYYRQIRNIATKSYAIDPRRISGRRVDKPRTDCWPVDPKICLSVPAIVSWDGFQLRTPSHTNDIEDRVPIGGVIREPLGLGHIVDSYIRLPISVMRAICPLQPGGPRPI